MFEESSYFGELAGSGFNPARPTLTACGYDKHCYISTAKLVSSPYVSQSLIQARIGGLQRLIESVDDSQPPTGTLSPNNPLNNPAYLTYLSVIQNVVTEINGYLSPIYPTPLAQTGTVAILQVATTSADGLGTVLTLTQIQNGNYLTAPAVDNFPAYMSYVDPLLNASIWGQNWEQCQKGTGLELALTFAATPYADESGQELNAQTLNTVAVTNGGTNYQVGELLVLTGGSSYVPAKIREAALVLICHSLYQRRLAPDEKNIFSDLAKMWREFLIEVGEGTKELDGTYKRFFSPVSCWGTESVLQGANSL